MSFLFFSFLAAFVVSLNPAPSLASDFRGQGRSQRMDPQFEYDRRSISERRQTDSTTLSQTALNNNVLIQLDILAQNLMRQYSPTDFDYVSVGTSPALLAEIIRSRSRSMGTPARVIDLPLSISNMKLWETRPEMSQHFRDAFAGQPMTSDRPLVFIDFIISGTSLTHLAVILTELQTKGVMTRPFRFYALHRGEDFSLPAKLRQDIPQWTENRVSTEQISVQTLPPVLDPYFLMRAFKQFSPYISWSARSSLDSRLPMIPVDPNEKVISDSSFVRSFSRNEMHTALNKFFADAERSPNFRLCFGAHAR